MKKYYLHNGSFQEGPFTIEELKSRGYTDVTPIWYDGLAGWMPAGSLDELKLATPPPHGKQTAVQNPPVFESVAPTGRKKGKSVSSIVSIVAGALLLLWLGAAAFANVQEKERAALARSQENERASMKELDKQNVRDNLAAYFTAERNAYTYSLIGGIENLQITVNNKSKYSVDELKVRVDYIKANGGLYKTEVLDFTSIPPTSSQTLRAPDSNRGISVEYKIISVTSTELGL